MYTDFDSLDLAEHIAELEARSIIRQSISISELEPIADFSTKQYFGAQDTNQINSKEIN